MSKKQKTLFETWNKTPSSPSRNRSDHNSSISNKNRSTPHHFRVFDASSSNVSSNSPFQSPKYTKKDELVNPEFDYEAGKTWIYPTNYPLRDYQFSIVQEALFKNTLVVLPTGLGKTFIAAVVMYNIYRWFPNGKVIFMAPTRPLVAQQVDACFNITGIPQEETTQMTGTNSPEVRKTMWMRKRVFFLTPQVLVNDLVRNICPPSTIRCLVVDEAHKALGNHAYCQVIKELLPFASQFRILALTATPGSETQSVKQILANLLISHVEIRSEDSADVQQYTHVRDIEKIVVPLGERLTGLKFKFLDVINTYLKRLTMRNVMSNKNPSSLSKFQVLKLREAFSQNPPGNIDRATYGLAMADFSLLISLYHAYELLLLHGATTFYNFLAGILKGDKSIPHARTELLKNYMFEEIMTNVKENYIPETSSESISHPNGQIQKRKVLPGHPKLDKLLEVILGHFEKAEAENITDTRVMIFTQYRDSVQEIVNMLNQYEPTVKVMSFIGQSSKSATNMGYSQKQQLKVIQQFRSGGYNTLVSTCVGEEGLDIGEIDLILCYDCPKSPIRSVQRMGRTGRLRKGRIVMLIAEGKEEQMYNTCEYRKKNVHQAIRRGFTFAQLYQNSAPLIPPDVKPICVKTVITVPKKLEPKTKVVSKSPFLNDEEMMEFNQNVKVPPYEGPLLPKREFIVLKNKEVIQESTAEVKPRLSLSEWTLWQTTPQRTDMIPHSSKSLLLVKTLEYIHFPELLSLTKAFVVPNLTDFQQKSSTDFSKSDFNSVFSNRTKKPIATCTAHAVDNEDVIELMPEEEIFEIDNHIKPSISPKKIPLMEQLFNVKTTIDCKKCAVHDLKPPPKTIRTFSIEEFSNLDLKEIVNSEMKGVSILRVLNKKLKAKLKRKSKVLGRSMFSKDIQSPISIKTMESPLKSINMNENHQPLVDAFTKINSEEKINSEPDSDGVLFDIDFDIPEIIENELEVYDNRITASNKETYVQNKHIIHDNKSKSHPSNLDVDCYDIGEKLANPKDIEEIDISCSPSCNKDFVDLETQGIVENVENSKAINLVCQLEYSKENLDRKSVSNAMSHACNKNRELIEDEKIFDSINFDLEFCEFSEESNNKLNEESNLSRKSVKANECSKHSFSESHRKNTEKADSNISTFSKSNNLMKSKDYYFNVSSSINEEKQSIVLNDMKQSSNAVIGQNSTIENSFNLKSCTSASTKNPSECVVNCINSVKAVKDISFSSNNEYKNVTMNNPSTLNTKTPPSLGINDDGMSILKNYKPEAVKSDENEKIYNANFSSDSCKKSKLSLKDKSKTLCFKDRDQCSKQTKSTHCISDSDIKCVKNSFSKNSENNYVECNFDVSFGNNDVEANRNSTSHRPDISESTKLHSFSNNLNPIDDMDEFDKDANSILEQLFTSQKNVSTDLNSSFSSPLTVKRCISEVGESAVNESTKKVQRTSSYSHVQSNNSVSKFHKQNESDGFKTPYRKNNLSLSKINSPRSNAAVNISADTSQCSLTQLLSLIDGTENSKICFETPPNKLSLKKASEPLDVSSEDEVCPTPPQKEIAKLKSEFLYSKKSGASRSLDFKDCDEPSTELLSFQKFAGNERKGKMLSSKNASKTKQNTSICENVEFPLVEKEEIDCEASPKISFDITFDLPFTEDKFEDSQKEEMLDLNNALIIESSSSEEKLSQNDCSSIFKHFYDEKDNLLNKNSTPKVVNQTSVICTNNSNKKDLSFSENIEVEDSESLLPQIDRRESVEISSKGLLNQPVSHSKILNSKSLDNANVSEIHISNVSCVQTKLKEKENELQKNNQHLKTASLEKIFENLSDDGMILDEKEIGNNDEQCIDLSEEKLCFDLNFDDQYTCDLLPTKISPKKHLDLQKQSLDQNVAKQKNNVGNSFMEHKTNEDLKTVSKKPIFKKLDVETFGKLNEASNELMGEFELGVEDQSFMLELNDNNHPSLNQNQTTFHVVDNNSSDEFDLCNPNQSKKSNRCNELSSKLATVRECKSPVAGCSSKKPQNSVDSKKDQANVIKKKLSSKLSTRNQTRSKIDLKNDTTVEDEEDDFQFIRRVEKKVPKPSTSNNRKRKKLSFRNDFLFTQAEASGSDNYESTSEEDVLEGSFIDDESPNRYNDTDQHAFYLKSLKNCAGLPKKFKLKAMANDNFFQEPNEDYSHYELDSFCVNDEEVLYVSSDEESKVSSNLKPKKKSKEYEKSKNKKKAFRRVISHDSSSEYEVSPKVSKCVTNNSVVSSVPGNPHDDSIIPVKKAKHKLVIVSSDEENEHQFVKPLKHIHKKTENILQHSNSIQSTSSKPAADNHKIEFDDFEDDIAFITTVSTKRNEVSLTSKKYLDATNVKHKPSACVISSNIPSTSKAMQCESDLSHIEKISFDVGWNEIRPSTSMNNEEPPSIVQEKNETFSSNVIDVDKSDSISVILVDSRELASGKPVISSLRNRHKINPVVISQTYADYIISNRIAVERVFDSEFNNIPMPPKIIEKVKQIIGLYEKLVIIVERDNRKNILSFNRNVTKYLQFVVHANLHSSIEVMFSKSTDHTSELIANLVQKEQARGFHINVPVTLNQKSKKLFDFYLNFPKMTPVCALNFIYYFPTVQSLLRSSVNDLRKKGCISSHKANSLYNYFKSEFTFHNST